VVCRRGAEAQRPAPDRWLSFPNKKHWDWLRTCRMHASAPLRLCDCCFGESCAPSPGTPDVPAQMIY